MSDANFKRGSSTAANGMNLDMFETTNEAKANILLVDDRRENLLALEGILRGLDDYWIAKGKNSFAYQGIALFDAVGANKIKEIADSLRELSYGVAVLADSDAPAQFSDTDAADLRGKGVNVTKWDGGLSLEERVFADLTWAGILGSFDLACIVRGDRDKVLDQISSQYGAGFNRDPAAWPDSSGLRTALGRAAKAGEGWFKRQDRAQE